MSLDIAQYFAIFMVVDLCYNDVSHVTIEQWDQSNNDVWIRCTVMYHQTYVDGRKNPKS